MKFYILFFLFFYFCAYLICKRQISASDKQLEQCIKWAKSKGLQLPKRPSFTEFFIVFIAGTFRFPLWIIIRNLQFAKEVRFYEREMKLLFDKWNLEKNN